MYFYRAHTPYLKEANRLQVSTTQMPTGPKRVLLSSFKSHTTQIIIDSSEALNYYGLCYFYYFVMTVIFYRWDGKNYPSFPFCKLELRRKCGVMLH